MTPIFTTKNAFRIIGIQFRGNNNNNECPKLWDRFSKRFDEVKPIAKQPIDAYGVCADFDMENNVFTYSAGIEVPNDVPIPEGMIEVNIPSHEYAVFECTLPTIMQTMEYIYKTWLPQSAYKRSNTPEFEYYDKDFDPQISESPMYLYIPIEKK